MEEAETEEKEDLRVTSFSLEHGRGRWILGPSLLSWGPQSPPTCKPRDSQPRARYWASRR